jgi:tetratricopeptide (TPR) repeat protein/predicted Ser/Thr protein kinase
MSEDATAPSVGPNLGARPPDSLRAELMRQRVRARMFGESGPPARIGRFRVSEAIGSGGMGTVYLAWDEQLARSIAIKLLHQRESDDLLGEAQALARLAHPNVVAVFDVGVHEGRVYLAMEHVPGRTLRAWQREAARQAELLAAWLAAGRGLAAVHEAGLIHRDVKPDNVLLGDDGRVRLIDFGLVLAHAGAATESGSGSGSSSDTTAKFGFAGTKEYAAPEQRAGSPIDARADQYAYCVSVWEALAGERPPRDEQGRPLATAIPGVARRLTAALLRGLALEPGDRWPDMAALLDALEPRRRRVDIVIAIAAALALGGTFGLLARDEPSAEDDRCASAGTVIDPSVAAELPDGPLREAVDRWIVEFQATTVRACEDHERTGLAAVLAQRSACLEYRRLELIGLLDHLASVRAGQVALDSRKLELGDPQACLRAADEALALPEQHAEAIAELRQALADISRRAGDRAFELIPEAQQVLERARATAWPPVIGEAALVLARVHVRASDPEPARELIGEVLDLADQHGQSELAFRAWRELVELAGDLDLDPKAASWAWQRQSAALERLGPTAYDRGGLALLQARIAMLRGDVPAAERALREAVSEFEHAGLSGRLLLSVALDRLASVVGAAGRVDEMQDLRARSVALERELAASSEPVQGSASEADRAFNASQIALASGDHTQALTELERALQEYGRASGSESVQVAQVHVALAQVYDAIGSLEEAERHAERADAICLARLGPDHPLRASTISAIGTLALRRNDHEGAVRAFRLQLQIEQSHPGTAGDRAALARSNLAEALLAAGDASEARWQAERALTELSALVPTDHPDLAYPHKALGAALLELGEHEQAKQHLTRALELPSWSEVETREIEALLARAN